MSSCLRKFFSTIISNRLLKFEANRKSVYVSLISEELSTRYGMKVIFIAFYNMVLGNHLKYHGKRESVNFAT